MAVISLLSGGLDSSVLLAWLVDEHRDRIALTIDYGQRNHVELLAARYFAMKYATDRHFMQIPALHGSPLTGSREIPDFEDDGLVSPLYVPGRNAILLSLAVSLAEVRGYDTVAIGCNADDAARFPDCTEGFLNAYNAVLRTQPHGIRVMAPFTRHSKAEIVQLGRGLGVELEKTVSCYRGNECGRCEACRNREVALSSTE